MRIAIFNIPAIRPTEGSIDALNEELEGINPKRINAYIVNDGDVPVWSILVFIDDKPHHKAGHAEPEITTNMIDMELYDALVDWRRHIAQKDNLPEYFIVHNDSLREISALKPSTIEELMKIKGIGEWKMKKYGDAILEIVRAFANEQNNNSKEDK